MFIVFEGCEGCGKSTQIKLTKEWLLSKKFSVAISKEPGAGGIVGKKLRELLLDKDINIDPITELFMYSSDRANHIHQIINPNLKENRIVLLDRFILSTITYQGYGRKINKDVIKSLIKYSLTNLIKNPIYIWIDRPLMKSLESKKQKDRLEQENIEFHQNVYQGYKELHQEFPNIIFRVNGDQSIFEVQKEIRNLFLTRIF